MCCFFPSPRNLLHPPPPKIKCIIILGMDIYASAMLCEIFHGVVYLGADHLNLIQFLVFNLFRNYYYKLFNVEVVIGFYSLLTLSSFCLF